MEQEAWLFVRVVKEVDSKSTGLCPHRFEPCSNRFHVFASLWLFYQPCLTFSDSTWAQLSFESKLKSNGPILTELWYILWRIALSSTSFLMSTFYILHSTLGIIFQLHVLIGPIRCTVQFLLLSVAILTLGVIIILVSCRCCRLWRGPNTD